MQARTPSTATDDPAVNRIRFLTAQPVDPDGVRESILASWSRSRAFRVAADRIELPYLPDPNLDTPLTRSAGPVLRSLAEQLDGQPISIVLTDAHGVVLTRLTADADLERHLDRVRLAPGFNYAEQFVGTNGIGTALEGGRPAHVFGHEHYAENLEGLACAGVPIGHPVTGKTVGVLDLTCWRRDAGPLLVALAKTTTEQIRSALLADTGLREIELLHEYLRTCRRTGGIVFALNTDVAMVNDYARSVLDPPDQDALLRRGADALGDRRATTTLDLPTGIRVRMSTHPVWAGGRFAGVVATVKVVELGGVEADDAGTGTRMLLPGLIGSGAPWRRACDEVESVFASGDWLALEGEGGVGKLAVLRAVHQRRNPTGRFTVLDAADATADQDWLAGLRRALAKEAGSVVIRHLDRLTGVQLRAVAAALQTARRRQGQAGWVAVTLAATPRSEELRRLLELFPRSLDVPPLRHHAEDIHGLVPFLLARLGYAGKLTCSPEVMQQLARSTWPGNIEQVLQTLRSVVQHRRTGTVLLGDLPPEVRTGSRRRLNPIESLERDAIVRGLADAHNNKAEAARALGMSRATIYRKIREYGIAAADRSTAGAS